MSEKMDYKLAIRCEARNRLGEQCARYAMPGANVCGLHGAKAPQVKRVAQERLLRGAEHAIDCILDILKAKPPCVHCGRADDPKVQLRAAQVLLDRAGLGPTSTLEIDDKSQANQSWTRWLTEPQLQQIADWILEAKLREEQEVVAEQRLLESQVIDVQAMETHSPAI